MATSNINKIVRGNLNLKPWILSKNSTDIVNGYVQRLYEQIPNKFKNELLQPRVAERQHIRKQISSSHVKPTEKFVFPIVNRSKTKIRATGYRSPPLMSTKNSFVAASKKFLKPPVYKIYNSRMYSSASSSSASFFRNNPEEARKKMYRPAFGTQYRSFKGAAGATNQVPGVDPFSQRGVSKYITPARVYNKVNSDMKTLNITSAICKDLMSVSDTLKKKIRLNKSKLSADSPDISARRASAESPFQGWNHPATSQLGRSAHIFMSKKPSLSQTKADVERRIHMVDLIAGRKKAFSSREYSPYLFATSENARFEMHKIPPYTGANVRPYRKKSEEEPESPKPKPPIRRGTVNEARGQRVNDFVCRSRTTNKATKSMHLHPKSIRDAAYHRATTR